MQHNSNVIDPTRPIEEKLLTINLFHMDKLQSRILSELFKQFPGETTFTKTCSSIDAKYVVLDSSENSDQIRYRIILSHTIVKFQRRKKPDESRYAILGSTIASGNQGRVMQVIGTLITHDDKVTCKPKQTRIAKIMPFCELHISRITRLDAAIHENSMMYMMADKYRPHAVIVDGAHSILISKYFKGVDLRKTLASDQFQAVSLLERLQLFRKILSEANRCHMSNVIHRDIKPDNIIIEMDAATKSMDAHLVDLGFSCNADLDTTGVHQPGSIHYAAPEAFQHKRLFASADVIALGRIGWLLIGNMQAVIAFLHLHDDYITSVHTASTMPNQFLLFLDTGITPELQHKLYSLFTGMNMRDPDMRTTIPDCLSQLDNIIEMEQPIHNMATIGTNIRTSPICASNTGLFSRSPAAEAADKTPKTKGCFSFLWRKK